MILSICPFTGQMLFFFEACREKVRGTFIRQKHLLLDSKKI